MKRYALLLISFPVVAGFAAASSCEGRAIERAERLYATGRPEDARIIDKHVVQPSGGKHRGSPIYTLTFQVDGARHERRVAHEDYTSTPVGTPTLWYVDPATGEGIGELERRHRTGRGGYFVLAGMGLVAAITLCRGWWQGLPGGASEARVRAGGPPCPPTTRARLPKPEREPSAGWDDWLRIKYPPLRFLLGLDLGGAAVLGLPALALGAPEVTLLMAIQAILGAWTILLARGRGLRRDRLLWRRGEERHAEVVEAKPTGNVRSYRLVFEFGGQSWSLRQRIPIEGDAMREGQRIVVLVDPVHPKRATVVPRGAERT